MKTLLIAVLAASIVCSARAQTLQSETPAHFKEVTKGFDFDRRDVMIPMRDGVHLHTVILVPRGAHRAPMLLTRTPYNATELTSYDNGAHLIAALDGYDNADDVIVAAGYIRVVQDVRGKYKSEGDYVMNRPLIGPLNDTKTDHSTDTYDTIEWLVHNVPESNGRVGTIGISYDGFTTLMSMVHPHPALKVAVPMNPMVDGWMGDDWFHRGAFRQLGSLNYVYEQEATRDNTTKWWTDHYDDYDAFLELGSAGAMAASHGEDQVGFYRKLTQHTAYDSFWQQQAMDKILASAPLAVPTMLVHSLWDQEDIYGAPAVYQALRAKTPGDDKLYLVMGPWHHGQEISAQDTLGTIRLGSDSGLYFREHILRPFLDHYLKDDAPPMDVAHVNAFESGTNRWLRLASWPQGCEANCPIGAVPMHLLPGAKLSPDAGTGAADAASSYVSDPARPVPFIQRPIHLLEEGEARSWTDWLSSDQREASTRPDVLSFTTDRLTAPVKIAGALLAHLDASITGTDVDFVVKVIDVYPDQVAQQHELGGYQLMVSGDILRGRFRHAYDKPEAVPANQKQSYVFPLPNANHVFLPGHRIMVQVQSTWFPLYDRNPQTFVDNIFFAKTADYQPETIKLFADSVVDLPVVKQ